MMGGIDVGVLCNRHEYEDRWISEVIRITEVIGTFEELKSAKNNRIIHKDS